MITVTLKNFQVNEYVSIFITDPEILRTEKH